MATLGEERVGFLKHGGAEGMDNADDHPGRRVGDGERSGAVGAATQGASGDPRTQVILAGAVEVHRQLGPGFEEIFYQRALAREFSIRNLDFGREIEIPVRYKGEPLGAKRIDFIVEDVLLEIKATTTLEPDHLAQALSYLRASGRRTGLLLNFGAPRLQIKRLVYGYDLHARGEETPMDG